LTFHSEAELREHIFKAIPGVLEEFNFLRETSLKFASVIGCWEALSETDKVSSDRCVGNVPEGEQALFF
jgi:hypothetical protein